MKNNQPSLAFIIRCSIFCIFFLLLAFTTGDIKSEYILPPRASSVCAIDLNLDGDNDILVGHNRSWQDTTATISFLENSNNGIFSIEDTSKSYSGYQSNIFAIKINNDEYPDIVSFYTNFSSGEAERYVRIWYNDSGATFSTYSDFNLFNPITISLINYGDINGDGFLDLIVASNGGKFYGVLYNDGTGNFSEPEYYDTELNPNDLAVGDIDGNGRDDIAIAGSDTEIYYSFESGFVKFTFSGYEHSIELEDMDNDGDLDVITLWGAFTTTVIVYENIGYQSFQPYYVCVLASTSGGIFTPDINNDSLADISFLAGGNFKYLINEGGLAFTEPDSIVIPDFTYGLNYTWGDLDNNNCPDIMVTKINNFYIANLKILFNDGNGNFGEDPITSTQKLKANSQQPIMCYPNPFTTETTIEININENEFAELSVYNLSGKMVKTLTKNNTKGGINTIKWDGLDNGGETCKPGPYLLTLKVNGNVLQTIKLMKY